MTDINNFISEMAREKDKLDMPVFLNFLRDELDRKGIKMTINRSSDLHLVPLNMSNIIGVELDLSDHDKEKEAEIEKYKKLLESREDLPTEPIKMADWIVRHFEQGVYPVYERDRNGDMIFIGDGETKIPVETGELRKCEKVKEIADYLLTYCKYHSEG